MKKRLPIVFTHIVFWILVILIRMPNLLWKDDSDYYLGTLIISMTLHAIIFYLFYFILGRYFDRKKLVLYVALFIPFILAYSIPITYVFIKTFGLFMNLGIIKEDKDIVPWHVTYFSVVTTQSMYAILGILMRFSINWFTIQKKQEELEKQNISNELALLKSQVNPHFLFNTLNNLHSFVKRDPDKTAFGIIKLSEIMRYMLYETNTEKVLLENEVSYLTNYIELQRLRLKDPNYIEFKLEGDLQGKVVSPLLLITLIENAFKHGSKVALSPGVSIILKIDGNSLTFVVTNYLATKSEIAIERQGFGLKNLQRRLDLTYGKGYNLNTQSIDNKFVVTLIIENL
jgi:two-component system, LytTR family, sensor kinase